MKLKIIACFVTCLLASVSFINGQNTPDKPGVSSENRELPKITDGSIQGKTKKLLLKGFCRKTTDCERFIVRKVERLPQLSGVEVFSITRPNHFSEYVLRYKNKSYVTLKSKDFGRFLKDYEMLSKPDLLSNFLQTYKYFKFDDGAINPFYVVDETYLAKYSEELKKYETGFEKIAYQSIHSPQMVKTDNGDVEIKFYADSPLSNEIKKINAIVSSKYQFQEEVIIYHLKEPVRID